MRARELDVVGVYVSDGREVKVGPGVSSPEGVEREEIAEDLVGPSANPGVLQVIEDLGEVLAGTGDPTV
jgi:hypothetical protein